MDQITPENRSKAGTQIIAEYCGDIPVVRVSGCWDDLRPLWASVAASIIADPGVIVGPYMLSPLEMAIRFYESQKVFTRKSPDIEGELDCWVDLTNRFASCLNLTPEQMALKIIKSQGTKENENHNT